jgi:hypothetical protein
MRLYSGFFFFFFFFVHCVHSSCAPHNRTKFINSGCTRYIYLAVKQGGGKKSLNFADVAPQSRYASFFSMP